MTDSRSAKAQAYRVGACIGIFVAHQSGLRPNMDIYSNAWATANVIRHGPFGRAFSHL